MTTVRCVEHVFRKIPRREGRCRGRRIVEKSCGASPSVHHCTVAQPTPSAGGKGVVHGNAKGAGEQLEVREDMREGGKFLPQRYDTNVIRYTCSNSRKVL